MMKELEQILDAHVRPMLHGHGGDVKILSYENGILTLKLQGQCLSCASADFTTDIIDKEIKQRMPGIKDIIFDQSVSEELLEMARNILKKKPADL